MKFCGGCKKSLPFSEFGKNRTTPDGMQTRCKSCRKSYRDANKAQINAKGRERYWSDPDKFRHAAKAYYSANKASAAERSKAYYEAHKEEISEWAKSYREANKRRLREQRRAYYEANKERVLQQQREYREKQDPEHRREVARLWRERNWSRIVEQKRAYYEAHQDEVLAYRAANKERIAAYNRDYREQNPHLWWAYKYRERCEDLRLAPVVEDFTKADVIARYGDACFYCETGEFEHLDHFTPISKGGSHTLENVRPSCAACNLAKSDTNPDEWLAEQDALDDLTEDELNDLIDAEIERWTN